MKEVKAQEIIQRLTPAQQTRLKIYSSNLSKDKDRTLFDDRMLKNLKAFALVPNFVEEIRTYLNSIGFTRSRYSYEQIQAQLLRFGEKNHEWYGWLSPYKQAKSSVMKEVVTWKLESPKYRGNESIKDVLPRRDTHAGFNFILTGLRTKGEYLDNIYRNYTSCEKEARRNGSFNTPILIGSRTQGSGEFEEDGTRTGKFKDKSRFVSIVGLMQILAECKFAKPFQERLGTTDWYVGGKNDDDVSVWINQRRSEYYDYSTTCDYSHFDQSISSWLISDAFDIVCAAFNQASFDSELFEIIKKDFICKCFIDGQGKVVYSEKGVPSGSMFTQIIDSIVNRLMITTYFNHLNRRSHEYRMLIMGDDNLIFSTFKIDEQDLAGYLKRVFGVEVNSEKSSAAPIVEAPEFLSRTWRREGAWKYSGSLVSKLLFPERFRYYESDDDCLAILGSYVRAFPLGMEELIDVKALNAIIKDKGIVIDRATKYMSGLTYYRETYMKSEPPGKVQTFKCRRRAS